jgi:hypothetical protein
MAPLSHADACLPGLRVQGPRCLLPRYQAYNSAVSCSPTACCAHHGHAASSTQLDASRRSPSAACHHKYPATRIRALTALRRMRPNACAVPATAWAGSRALDLCMGTCVHARWASPGCVSAGAVSSVATSDGRQHGGDLLTQCVASGSGARGGRRRLL